MSFVRDVGQQASKQLASSNLNGSGEWHAEAEGARHCTARGRHASDPFASQAVSEVDEQLECVGLPRPSRTSKPLGS